MRQILVTLVGVAAFIVGVWGLEAPRQGLEIRTALVGATPVRLVQLPDADGPVVVIAHGFAGSQQLMAAWQLTLARAGYLAVSFDFAGHGRSRQPMMGSITELDGTTRQLMAEITAVTDWALSQPGANGEVALLGHSMASDIIVRQALEDPRVGPVVAISLFSQAVTETEPQNLLIINGAWEGMLREEAQRIMAEAGAEEGETVGNPSAGFARRAVVPPFVEHVGVLYAPLGLQEAVDWLDASFGRNSGAGPVALGPWIGLTFFGVVLLASPLARLAPSGPTPWRPTARVFWALALGPAMATPLILSLFDTRFLPVLVADYLAVHLALYGALVLAGAWALGAPRPRGGVLWGLALAAFGIIVFGGLLDRYVGSFVPNGGRLIILAFLVPGAVLALLADATLNQAMRAPVWRRAVVRLAFLGSLGGAVALDFERLFFLIIILPVILLFYGTFGMMGRFLGRRTGSVVAVGLGLGIILGWALGVTFPLFDPGT